MMCHLHEYKGNPPPRHYRHKANLRPPVAAQEMWAEIVQLCLRRQSGQETKVAAAPCQSALKEEVGLMKVLEGVVVTVKSCRPREVVERVERDEKPKAVLG